MPDLMPVTAILNTVPGDFSRGTEWTHVMNSKMADKGFWRLLEDMDRDGQQKPISLYKSPWDSETTLSNGHHRLAAAILLAWDYVLVYNEADVSGWGKSSYKDCLEYDIDGNYVPVDDDYWENDLPSLDFY